MSLVTVARYRFLTRDVCTDDETVSARLEEAQALIEDEYRRPLEEAERTETVPIWGDGRVYPTAVPITAVPDDAAYVIADQAALRGVYPDAGGSSGWAAWSCEPADATVTYTGGWTTETVPAWLEHAIADLAHALAGGSSGSGSAAPIGATSIRVGDVAVTYGAGAGNGASGLDTYLAGIGERTRRLWRPRLRP